MTPPDQSSICVGSPSNSQGSATIVTSGADIGSIDALNGYMPAHTAVHHSQGGEINEECAYLYRNRH